MDPKVFCVRVRFPEEQLCFYSNFKEALLCNKKKTFAYNTHDSFNVNESIIFRTLILYLVLYLALLYFRWRRTSPTKKTSRLRPSPG